MDGPSNFWPKVGYPPFDHLSSRSLPGASQIEASRNEASRNEASRTKQAELERFVSLIERQRAKREQQSRGYSRMRLAISVVGVGITFLFYRTLGSSEAWMVAMVFAAIFSITAYLHNRVILSIRRHRLYSRIKSAHIARIKRDWDLIPAAAPVSRDSFHPFAADLDLTGPRSLHHLVDTSFTKEGSHRLTAWLLGTVPDPDAIRKRRAWVRELVPLSWFRDKIALLSALATSDSSEKWKGDTLIHWLQTSEDEGRIRRVLYVLGAFAVLTPMLGLLHFTIGIDHWWALSLFAYVSVYLMNSRLYGHLFDEAEHLYYQLSRFRSVLLFLERFRFKRGSELDRLAAAFQDEEKPPSSYLRTAMWIAVAASTQKNDVLRVVLNLLLPWELFFSLVLDRYKNTLRDRLPIWLDALQQLEAASSLASFAELNPGYCFPETNAREDEAGVAGEAGERFHEAQPIFRTRQLGHPLLAEEGKVRNDFEINAKGDLALITGSNMSGKSTFLRTLGTNLALAFAGGPVDASSFRTSPVRIFTCINVSDSVNDGISYFYAEVKRLKRLLLELKTEHDYPLFYLVDEVFRGTNNRERFIGARSLLLELCRSDGVGAVSTHDLELVKLESEVTGIHNYHFREFIENGRMEFDYTLRPGPCPTTNALKIMRMEGLPVDETPLDEIPEDVHAAAGSQHPSPGS